MGSWWKCDDEIITNAKVGRAVAIAEHSFSVYMAMLCLHSKFGAGGLVPASHCDAEGLRIEACAVLGRVSAKRIEAAVAACVQVRLLSREGNGIRIAGFNEQHMPECSRCHQPNPEPSHGTCPDCRRKKTEARRAAAAVANGDGGQRQGREGHAPTALASARTAPGCPGSARLDRTGQDRNGTDGTGSMDGRMDGEAIAVAVPNHEGGGTAVPRGLIAQPGAIASALLRRVAP